MAEAAPAYDYVVVGGGTAGCVPANRRSVDTVGAGGRCRSRRGGQDDWSRIRSADAHHATSIRRCHLGTNEDRCEAMASLHLARRIVAQPPLARFAPRELRPGSQRLAEVASPQGTGEVGTPIFRPVAACRMGGDADAVVVRRCACAAWTACAWPTRR